MYNQPKSLFDINEYNTFELEIDENGDDCEMKITEDAFEQFEEDIKTIPVDKTPPSVNIYKYIKTTINPLMLRKLMVKYSTNRQVITACRIRLTCMKRHHLYERSKFVYDCLKK